MKKLLLFITIAMIGVVASAADQTKEQYLAAKKAATKAGKTFDEAKTIKEFDKKDLNKDGVFSDEEQAAEKAAAKAAADAKKAAKKAE